jgi:outer membrane lipopolysaccharide assembly protein LptE/RlpB
MSHVFGEVSRPRDSHYILHTTYCILALVLCAAVFSCGYRLAGTGSVLPAHIKRVHIPYFENQTPRFEIEQRLTEQVQRQFNVRAKLEIVKSWSEADAVLEAAVTSFEVRPIAFTEQIQANRYEVIIGVSAKLTDTKSSKEIWQNPGFVFRGQYESAEVIEDYYNQELEAIDQIAADFAETLVATITQGF